MFLLIDADSLLWKSALGINTDSFDGTSQCIPDPEDGYNSFVERIKSLSLASGIPDVVMVMSCGESFRKKLWPSYKSHRPSPPPIVGQVKKLIMERLPIITWPGLEGDDIVGIYSDIPGSVIYSEDKDLLQIPGSHWSWNLKSTYLISHKDAMRFFYTQVLTGDNSDGYPGCPGVGKIKAQLLMHKTRVEDMWDLVCMAYEIRNMTEQDAFIQAQVAWILRTSTSGIQTFIPPARRTTLAKKV